MQVKYFFDWIWICLNEKIRIVLKCRINKLIKLNSLNINLLECWKLVSGSLSNN